MTVTHGTTALGAPAAPAGPRASLRERKKIETRRALRRFALDLVAERGFSHVTVEDIAEAAGVSPRTFFNYFPSKEAALFGAHPERAQALRQRLVHHAPGDTALQALRAVLVAESRVVAAELAELGGDPAEWLRRMRASHVDPHLRAAQAANMAMVEGVVAAAIAERLGMDPERDPYPVLLASAAMGALRATMTFWASTGGVVALDCLTDAAFQALAEGLPEDRAARCMGDAANLASTTETTGQGRNPGRNSAVTRSVAMPLAHTSAGRKDDHR
jgi:AcrR family transcriptional regulator